jgi:hypothetical protein
LSSEPKPSLPACSVDGRPYLRENRRVKAWGLALMALAAPGAAWFSAHPLADRWLSGSTRDLAIAAAVFLFSLNLAAVGGLVLASGLGILRPWSDARGRWGAGLVLAAVNVGIPVLAFSLMQEDATIRGLGDAWVMLATMVALALFIGIVQLFRRSQRWEALSADEALQRDPRPPVVYLRAFTDDGLMAVPGHHWQDRMLGKSGGALTLTSPEQELAFILQRVGPVIAIGKPGERLPELGAARLYVGHDTWQQTVIDMLQRSSLVLARAGVSPGVQWELDQVLALAQRSKVVILILGSAEDQAAGVRAVESRIGEPLPLTTPPVPRFRRLLKLLAADSQRSIGVLVGFDAAGRAIADAIPMTAYGPSDLVRSLMLRPYAGALRAACRKLLVRMGHEWRDPPNRLFAVVLAFVVGGLGGHWFYLGDRRRAVRRLLLVPVIWLTVPYAWFEACRWVMADRRQFEAEVSVRPIGR